MSTVATSVPVILVMVFKTTWNYDLPWCLSVGLIEPGVVHDSIDGYDWGVDHALTSRLYATKADAARAGLIVACYAQNEYCENGAALTFLERTVIDPDPGQFVLPLGQDHDSEYELADSFANAS